MAKTQGAGTAFISLKVSISGTPDIGSLFHGTTGTTTAAISETLTGSGAFDFTHKTGTLTLTTAGANGSANRNVEIRLLGRDLYLTSPQLLAIDGGKPWVHVDASSYSETQNQSSGALGGFEGGDPTNVLQMLDRITGTVSEVGSTDIEGVPTTQYRATVDLTRPKSSTSTGSNSFGQRFAQLFGLGSVPVEVWVDSAGRARRVEVSLSLFGVTVLAQENLNHFGSPVVVTAPPAGQVADGSALLANGQLKNLLGGSGPG